MSNQQVEEQGDQNIEDISDEVSQYDDADAQEQINNFYEEAEEEEVRQAGEDFDYYCNRHQIGFDDYQTYANHMIKHDPILAYKKGIARYFCKLCRRLFVTQQRRAAHFAQCRLRRPNSINAPLSNMQRRNQDLLQQLNYLN
ncbi:hypothetical protein ABPG74_004869 [Tetrahymena malaccensis]